MTTKAIAISKLATELNISKVAASSVYSVVAEIALEGLKEDGMTIVPGLGRLKAVTRSARKARNPKTGASIDVPAKVVLKLVTAKGVKAQFN